MMSSERELDVRMSVECGSTSNCTYGRVEDVEVEDVEVEIGPGQELGFEYERVNFVNLVTFGECLPLLMF